MSAGGDAHAVIAGFAGEIGCGRVRLRLPEPGDVDVLLPHFADWDVVRWLAKPEFPVRRAQMVDFVAGAEERRLAGGQLDLVIVAAEGPVGMITWRMTSASIVQETDGSSVGFWIGRAFWGRGYMTAAAGGLVDHIFADTPADVIYSGVFDGNIASLRVQEKLGFTVAGRAMIWCNPRQETLSHINTVLRRSAHDRTAR